jgi:hypothetical protein
MKGKIGNKKLRKKLLELNRKIRLWKMHILKENNKLKPCTSSNVWI